MENVPLHAAGAAARDVPAERFASLRGVDLVVAFFN